MQRTLSESSRFPSGVRGGTSRIMPMVLLVAALGFLVSCSDGPVEPRHQSDLPEHPDTSKRINDEYPGESSDSDPVGVIADDVPKDPGSPPDGSNDPEEEDEDQEPPDETNPDPDPQPEDNPWDSELPRAPAGTYAALWMAHQNNIWIVGAAGQIARFDGQRWQTYPSATAHDLHRIRGISGQHLWAVGHNGAVVHYEGGSTWEAMTLPQETAVQLYDLYVPSAQETWAVGWDSKRSCGVILRRTLPFRPTAGVGRLGLWRELRCIENKAVNGIYGFADGTLVAVGDNGFVTRFDGSDWEDRHWGGMHFHQVWGLSATEHWAVGSPDIFWYWNGRGWLGTPGPERAGYRTLHGVSRERIWIVPYNQQAVFALEGQAWSSFPTGVGEERTPVDVYVHPSDGVWALLQGGTLLQRAP